jgi:hypothetical protein
VIKLLWATEEILMDAQNWVLGVGSVADFGLITVDRMHERLKTISVKLMRDLAGHYRTDLFVSKAGTVRTILVQCAVNIGNRQDASVERKLVAGIPGPWPHPCLEVPPQGTP